MSILQACLNGNRSAGVPASAAELADAARTCRAEGAQEFHIHPRDASGRESLAPEVIGDAIRALRRAVPGAPVGVSTGDWIGGAARIGQIAAWKGLGADRPDYASVNLSEPDAPQVFAALAESGTGIEAGIASAEDADRFVGLWRAGLPAPLVRVLIELPPDAAEADYRAIRAVLAPVAAPMQLHGEAGSCWPMLRLAACEGLQMRIGLEDCLTLPDGQPAADNAAMLRAARAIIAAAG